MATTSIVPIPTPELFSGITSLPTPTLVLETAVPGNVQILWQNVGRAAQIEIWRDVNGGGSVLYATVPPIPIVFTDTATTAPNDYAYVVRGKYHGIVSAFSNSVFAPL